MDDFTAVIGVLAACAIAYFAWQRKGRTHEQDEKDRRYMKTLDDKQGRE